MKSVGVHLSVDDDVSPLRLHDLWLQLFRRRTEAARVASGLWQQWKDAEASGGTATANRLWKEYSAFQSDYRVLSAWTDLVHTAWVFATEGRECRFLAGRAPVDKTFLTTS